MESIRRVFRREILGLKTPALHSEELSYILYWIKIRGKYLQKMHEK